MILVVLTNVLNNRFFIVSIRGHNNKHLGEKGRGLRDFGDRLFNCTLSKEDIIPRETDFIVIQGE